VITPAQAQILQIYNILLRKLFVQLKFKSIGRNWFDENSSIPIREFNIELWRGVIATLAYIQAGVSLNVDVTFRTIRKDTAAQVIASCGRDKDKITNALQGQTVLTTYTRSNSKTHVVGHIEWGMTPLSTMPGTTTTFVDYYRQNYNIRLQQQGPPLLAIHQGKEDIHLMPELCVMTGITTEMRTNFRTMKAISEITRLNPNERARQILQFVNKVATHECLKPYGISIPPKPLPVNAMILAPERVSFKQSEYTRGGANWSSDCQRGIPTQTINPATVLLIYPGRMVDAVREFDAALRRACEPMSIKLPDCIKIGLPNDHATSYQTELKAYLQNGPVDLILCILASESKEKYEAVKRLLSVEFPVPSQVVLAKSIDNPHKLMTIATRVAHQINCKLGGFLWNVDIPIKKTMIVGIDVCHSRGKSVVAMCGTTNATFNKYFSTVTFQEKNEEVSTFLKGLMNEILKGYFRANSELPDRVVVYRDGVGDGQLESVVKIEIPQIEAAFAQVNPSYKPPITFIVVKKKVHTRVFVGTENPQPGTVCPQQVTHNGWYDFYLTSNHVNQGSATPTHYHVIKDGGFLTNWQIYSLTYKLTHLYFNWPGTVRVPAPCMYAHKLAFLVGQTVHRIPAERLWDKLYFL